MLDKIGIIGNTQGVNESNKPATKKPAITSHKLPDFKARVVLSSFKLNVAAVAVVFAIAPLTGKSKLIFLVIGA